jgi:hypothetical protein
LGKEQYKFQDEGALSVDMTWVNTVTAGAKEKKDESLLLMVRLS